jgi:hypothetical protein
MNSARPLTAATVALVLLMQVLLLTGCSGKTESSKTAEGKSPAKTGTDPKTPADVKADPIAQADFPMPDGVKVVATFSETRTISMRGPNKLDEYLKFYETKLGDKGWKKNAAKSETVEGVGYLELDKGKLTIGITLNPSRDGKTMTIMAQGSGVSVPKEKDAD